MPYENNMIYTILCIIIYGLWDPHEGDLGKEKIFDRRKPGPITY